MTSPIPSLDRVRRAISPRFSPPPTPLRAVLIHGFVTLLWLGLFARAFGEGGLLGWSVGLAYVGYDSALLLFVWYQTLPLLRPAAARPAPALPKLGVIVAARNEAAALPATLAALFEQDSLPDEVLIADDGSNDGTAALLVGTYELEPPAIGEVSAPSAIYPELRWLRLAPGGKARALNAAIRRIGTEVVMTVDADTLLDRGAVSAMRRAFAADPRLVAATGILFPMCGPTISGRLLERFQRYEYMRNFLSRYTWGRQDGLLLISGAFAAYRRWQLIEVGGFDTDCLVEDYELTSRLLDYSGRRRLAWRTDVIGAARARTEAPGTVAEFLRQRRRWFGGFLQTQLWYRHMVGNPQYGRLGTRMLPVKALDTMQPIYGLTAAGVLVWYAAGGRSLDTVWAVIAGKIALDLAFYLWSLRLYRRWAGGGAQVHWGWAVVAAVVEPFSFQLLRQLGAALGWVSFLTGERRWGSQERGASQVPTIRFSARPPG